MILASRKDTTKSKQGFKVLDLKCDNCEKLFICNHCVKAAEQKQKHYCSKKCINASPDIRKARSIASNAAANKIRESLKLTCLKRYNVENFFETKEFQEKRVKTLIMRFGVDHQSKSPVVVSKQQKGRGRMTQITHWKTNKQLNCEASYEVAFVNWCNFNQIDFDWQIPYKLSDGHVYFIDAFIKTGLYENTWIEIKGWMTRTASLKWNEFHSKHIDNSQLWDRTQLEKLQILIKGKPNKEFKTNEKTNN